MSREAPNKRTGGATRKGPPPAKSHGGWSWFFTGMLCGVFISLLGYIALSSPDTPQPAEKPVAKSEPAKNQTKFDFYTLLPEREVIVPEQESQSTTSAQPTIQYILQAGSFRSIDDADRLRAKLILMGLDANVDSVTSHGDTWHRILVGPFTSRSKMSKARQTLISEGVDTLLLKRKLEG